MDSKGSGAAAYSTASGRHSGTTLTDAIRMWPTVRTSDTNGAGEHGQGGMDLRTRAAMWPTPDAFVSNDGEQPETFEARRAKVKESAQNGNGMGTPLAMACKMWSTPTAQDASNTVGPSQFDRNSQPLNTQASLLDPTTAKAGSGTSPSAHGTLPVLNPRFVEALQGFETGWTEIT